MLTRANIMAMTKQKLSPMKSTQQGKSAQRGVVLLEALVAILLFSMGVLALVGLQAAMIKNTSESKFRAEASYIAQQWIGRMWADPTQPGAYVISSITDPRSDISAEHNLGTLPGGIRLVTQPDSTNFPNLFMVTIKWQQPGQIQHNYTTTVNVAGG
jgi:type IV pilus assembly protein PilV